MEEAVLSAVGIVGLVVPVAYMLARRLHVPIVVIYLLVGALAGPSLLGLVDPHELGEPFHITLELLVALIVFEGAFSIDVAHLRRVGRVVRNLLTVGLAITFLMATLLAGLTDVLPWRAAFLFGALVTVTGPTVIGPLVRSIRLNDHVRAVLLGEGVLIDPVGALLAIVVLDFTLSGLETSPLLWAPSQLLGGAALALVEFAIVRGALWLNREPSSAETSLLLFGASIATFGLAERVLPGSGLTAVAVLGVSLAATKIPHAEDVRSFEDESGRRVFELALSERVLVLFCVAASRRSSRTEPLSCCAGTACCRGARRTRCVKRARGSSRSSSRGKPSTAASPPSAGPMPRPLAAGDRTQHRPHRLREQRPGECVRDERAGVEARAEQRSE